MLLIVECSILVGYLRLSDPKFALTEGTQFSVIRIIIFCSFVEYGLLAINTFVVIYSIIREKKL
jgi:hypothetical protein